MGVGRLIIGIIIPLSIFGCVSTEICSVYNNVQILKNNDSRSNSYLRSYNLEEYGELSIDIEIKFECKVIIFNAENITHISRIKLENTANHYIYTTDDYSIYENIILKISFAENIPPGGYRIDFNYKSEIDSPAVLSEWIVLTNFDDDHVNEKNSNATRVWLRKSALGHGKYLVKNVGRLLEAFENFTGFSYNKNNEEIFFNEDNIATNNAEQLYRTLVEMMVNQAFEGYNPPQVSPFSRLAFTLRKYLVYLITDKAIPSWHLQDEYARLLRYNIFESDYLFSHLHAYDIFDSYPNNGLVLRMIEHAAGKEFFSNSLKTYLRNRTAVYTTSFFTVLMEMSGDRKGFLKNVFTSWINNIGYPVVTITRNYENNSAIITQSRFLRNSNETSIVRYWIALNNATQENADFDDTTVAMWLDPKIKSLEIVTLPPDEWMICNKQQSSYYRVNYDERNWKLIADYLKSENYQKIHVLNRAQLIDDAFVLAEFGHLNFNVAFNLARYLKFETEYVPWATFWEKMFRLYQYSSISSSQYYEPFKKMILELSGPLERKFLSDAALDGNDRMERLNKIAFIKWTCFYGSTLCRTYSLDKLKKWLADPVEYPLLEDIRKEILCAGIRSAGKETWEQLLEKYLIDKDETILFALMCSSKYQLLEQLIMLYIDNQLATKNSWFFFMTIAQRSTIGLDAIIHFISQKQKTLFKKNSYYDIFENMCAVIEQFINNNVQLENFQKILSANQKLLGLDSTALHRETAIIRVQHANLVLQRLKV